MAKALSAKRDDMTCVIVNMVTGKVIEIVHVPDEVSDANSANFNEIPIQGRSTPVLGYEGSGPRNVTFTIQLHEDYLPQGITRAIHELKALTYPLYNGYVKPPRCYVRLGNSLKVMGVCNDVNVTYQKPYRNGKYIKAEVALSFRAALEIPLSANDVEWGEG